MHTVDLNIDSVWGPFSPLYLGLSRILDPSRGIRADVALHVERAEPKTVVLPDNIFGYLPDKETGRRRTTIRAVPEGFAPDYHKFVVRYLLDKNGDTALARFYADSPNRARCEITFHNTSHQQREYRFGMGVMVADPRKPIRLKPALRSWWLPGRSYAEIDSFRKDFSMGCRTCVSRAFNWSLEEKMLAQAFGGWPGDRVLYRMELPSTLHDGFLYFRYVKYGDNDHPWQIRIDGRPVRFRLPRTWAIPGGGWGKNRDAYAEWRLLRLPVGSVESGPTEIELMPVNPPGNDRARIWLDGMLFSEGMLEGDDGSDDLLPTTLSDVYSERQSVVIPHSADGAEARLKVCVPGASDAIMVVNTDAGDLAMRRGEGSYLGFLRDEHGLTPAATERDAGITPWSSLLSQPISVPGREKRTKTFTLEFMTNDEIETESVRLRARERDATPARGRHEGLIEHMRAALLFNVNYPFEFAGRYTPYIVPSKNFPLPYSWDGGFAAVGLASFAPEWAWKQTGFFMAEEEQAFPFFYCGSPVPTPLYALWDALQKTGDTASLQRLYGGAKRMHDFYMGRTPGSEVNAFGDGMLSTYAYNYNLGIDDHPIQRRAEERHLTNKGLYSIILMAQVARCARILRNLSQRLGHRADAEQHGRDFDLLAGIIDQRMWDEESGLYGWLYRTEEGKVAPVQLDGCAGDRSACAFLPLFAGIDTHKKRLIEAMDDPQRFMTPYGVSSVDMQAPSFNPNGYWNGAVWPVMQWYLWRGLLEVDEPARARQVAERILDTCQDAWERDHYLGEHFVLKTRRMCGAPNFAGLNAALLPMHAAYFTHYEITTLYDVMLLNRAVDTVNDTLTFKLEAPFLEADEHLVLVNMGRANARYAVSRNGRAYCRLVSDRHGHLNLRLPRPQGEEIVHIKPETDGFSPSLHIVDVDQF